MGRVNADPRTSDPSPTLLLVEDDAVDRLTFERTVRELDFDVRVSAVSRIRDALDLLRERSFGWVVSDYRLPDGEGVSVLEAVRRSDPHLPVIMLTGRGDESLATDLMRRGASDYIAKSTLTAASLSRSLTASRQLAHARRATEEATVAESLLAAATAPLVGALELPTVVEAAVRGPLARWADAVILDLYADEGPARRYSAGLEGGDLVEEERPHPGADAAPVPPGRQFDSGSTTLHSLEGSAASALTGLVDCERTAGVLAARGVDRAIISDLVARGRLRGRLYLLADSTRSDFGERQRLLTAEFSARLSLAIDNALLHREVRRAVDIRQNVMAMVAHDLRNPLNAVYAAVHLLAESGTTPDRATSLIDLISRASDRMSQLISDLLDLTKMEAGGFTIRPATAEAGAIVDLALETLQGKASDRAIELVTEIEDTPAIRADVDQIQRVIWNLVGNALKATPQGSTVRIAVRPEGPSVRFSVHDQGPGVADEHRAHLFSWFWQADSHKTGAGLGLAIAKSIVELHGGEIGIEPDSGQGATFYFTVPVAERSQGSVDDRDSA